MTETELMREIVQIASLESISPMEISKRLPSYTQKEVFEAIDRLEDEGRAYFDVESDILIIIGRER